MAEETVWTGTSSQIKNLGIYLLCILILPIPYALWKWLLLKSHVYRLTTERLLTTEGILAKNTESMELYRVKDFRVKQSFIERLFGLESIELLSSDLDTPDVVIDYIPQSLGLSDKIRQNVENCRVQKRTRDIELE
jgi:uncharacterized membrane protein YdbT with pleckstrin-like domain